LLRFRLPTVTESAWAVVIIEAEGVTVMAGVVGGGKVTVTVPDPLELL
jgi:hypothetical protein